MREQDAMLYFAASSDAELREACADCAEIFGLAQFEFERHGHWEYGSASNQRVRFNVTRCPDHHTIETWIPGTPRGVNYQIIVSSADAEWLSSQELALEHTLSEIFDAEVEAYHEVGIPDELVDD